LEIDQLIWRILRPALYLVPIMLLPVSGGAQTAPDGNTTPLHSSAAARQEPLLIEIGGFTNFVDNGYGQWRGATGRVMYRGAKRFTPMFEFASQTRSEGSQATFGADSYVVVNRWFYAIVGAGTSPGGTAALWPRHRYSGTGVFTVPRIRGLVATASLTRLEGEARRYDRIVTGGALYRRGRFIWSGSMAFNNNYPGAIPSKSAAMGVQYGEEKKFWIGGSFNGGRIAYQMISLTPLDVRFASYAPGAFYSKWLNEKVGVTVRYEYQNQVDAFERHGVAANLFFELP
jgi:YaiO family outer membrane protein